MSNLDQAVQAFKISQSKASNEAIERLEASLSYNLKKERFQEVIKESKREIARRYADQERTIRYFN